MKQQHIEMQLISVPFICVLNICMNEVIGLVLLSDQVYWPCKNAIVYSDVIQCAYVYTCVSCIHCMGSVLTYTCLGDGLNVTFTFSNTMWSQHLACRMGHQTHVHLTAKSFPGTKSQQTLTVLKFSAPPALQECNIM